MRHLAKVKVGTENVFSWRKDDEQCSMCLSIALRISRITKSKLADLAQFWLKLENFSSVWFDTQIKLFNPESNPFSPHKSLMNGVVQEADRFHKVSRILLLSSCGAQKSERLQRYCKVTILELWKEDVVVMAVKT